jgi:hypothetical protein
MLITQLVYRIGFRGTSTRIAQPPQKDDEALYSGSVFHFRVSLESSPSVTA